MMAVRDVAVTPVLDADGELTEVSGNLTIKYRSMTRMHRMAGTQEGNRGKVVSVGKNAVPAVNPIEALTRLSTVKAIQVEEPSAND